MNLTMRLRSRFSVTRFDKLADMIGGRACLFNQIRI